MKPAQMTASRTGNRFHAAAKILFDRMGAAIALLALWPILAGIAVGIRLTMGSPVLFRQVRAGRDGVPFTILKFRTMEMRAASCCGRPSPAAESRWHPERPSPGSRYSCAGPGWTSCPAHRHRRGEMSFIGPRPLMVRYIPRYTAEQRRRHSVLPGISGWAQVNGRTDLSWSDRLTLDVW